MSVSSSVDELSPETADLLDKDSRYCSYGDTVHYADPPKIFERCDGSYLFDERNTPYLDLQMWYSAVNFGYENRRLNDALKRQIDTLPQLACQYLHAEKVELAEALCKVMETAHRIERTRPFQRRRRAGGRGLSETRAQCHREESQLRVHGRIPRPDPRRVRHHVELSLPPPLRPFFRPRAIHPVSLLLPLPVR